MNTLSLPEDFDTMTPKQRQDLYPGEYNAWKNLKQRCKDKNLQYSTDLEEFAGFMKVLGPKPHPSYTVHRIDTAKGYYDENIRWADKETQSRERTNSVFLTYAGKTQTLSQWATETGIDYQTLYARHTKGWPPHEIIEGKEGQRRAECWNATPWPNGEECEWELHYRANGAEMTRETFLYRKAKQELYIYRELLELGKQTFTNDAGEEIPVTEPMTYWEGVLKTVTDTMEAQKRKEKFINRKSGLGATIEKKIYDLVGDSTFDNSKMKSEDDRDYRERMSNSIGL